MRKTAPAKAPTHAPTTVVVEMPELLEATALSVVAASVELGRAGDEDVGVDGRLLVETVKFGEPVRGASASSELTASPPSGTSEVSATTEPPIPDSVGVAKGLGSCRLKGFR